MKAVIKAAKVAQENDEQTIRGAKERMIPTDLILFYEEGKKNRYTVYRSGCYLLKLQGMNKEGGIITDTQIDHNPSHAKTRAKLIEHFIIQNMVGQTKLGE